ncbi:MAG: metal-sensing transcriptional repressor [Candidatus Methanomethylophilaceae archaeon]|nr:metal-sensing transcriptional repressor [Candidatus Methanomethylophilaceae archaeon]
MHDGTDVESLHRRFKKIIGQIQAIERMIDEDVACEDILTQISAAKSALNKAGQVVLEGHIKHCIRDAVENNDEEALENFTKALERFSNMQ